MRAIALALPVLLAWPARAQNNVTGTTPSSSLNSGPIIFEGGTLQAQGGNIPNLVQMAGNGTVDAVGQSSTLSGVISGAGSPLSLIDSVGGGMITLSGANTYTGTTAITGVKVGVANRSAFGSGSLALSGATLQAQSANLSLANPVQLNGAANVIDANGKNLTFSGPFFGGGGVTLKDGAGGGMITLSGGSYYTGVTAINAGTTVGLGAAQALGVSQLTLSGATLKLLAAGADLPNPIRMTGADVVDAAGNSGTFSGSIAGSGGLTLNDSVGGGVLSLGGAGSWSGGTTLNGGTLRMAAAGVMPLGGTLAVGAGATFDMNGFSQTLASVANNGSVKTGAATLTLSGGYSGSGMLSVTPLASAANVSVSGAATLTGQTLNISGHPATGNYTIVAAAGGLGGTTFSALTGLPGGYRDVLTYTADDVLLSLFAPTLVHAGQTSNQMAVAAGLDQETAGASDDMAAVLSTLNGMSSDQLNASLDQISPIAYSAMSGLALASAGVQKEAVGRRVAALQSGTTDALESPWGVFFQGLDTMGRMAGVNGSAGFQPGYNLTAFGGMTGVDYRFSEDFAAGLTAGYVTSAASLESGTGQMSDGSLRFGAFATSWGETWRSDFYAGGAADSFSMTRDIAFGTFDRQATASPSAAELNLAASFSTDYTGAAGTLSPFLGLAYDRLMAGAFSESGAGALNLDVGSQTADSLRSTLGVKLRHRYDFDGFALIPFADAGWEREILNQSRSISARFQAGGGSFSVATADAARDGLLYSGGLSMDFGGAAILRLAYSGERRSDFTARTIDGSLRVQF